MIAPHRSGQQKNARTRSPSHQGDLFDADRPSTITDESFDAPLPLGWKWARVDEAGEVTLGRQRSPRQQHGSNMRPYLRVANVFEDRIDTSNVLSMNFDPDEVTTYALKSGDILLNEGQSPELVGRPAMYKNEVPGACFQNTLIVGEVQEFLSRLYDRAMLPVRMDRRIAVDLTKNPAVESLYLFLPRPEALAEVYRSYGNQYAFFTALESTHLSKVLGEVRTRVGMTPGGGGGEVTYRDLSEGEQQLLLVLGLLKFTARDEALFLLDEPDTHLNPAWSTQYLAFLDHFIRGRDSCHILMSSHDPLVFAGLEKAQVRIFRRDEQGRAVVEVPDQDPRGMGVAAILTSDLFRLRSSLDSKTQADLDRQRLLAMKAELTSEEEEEMRRLKEDLHGRGFDQTIRDPLYHQFLEAWTEQEDQHGGMRWN
jgi:hypothetical protein